MIYSHIHVLPDYNGFNQNTAENLLHPMAVIRRTQRMYKIYP